MEKPIVSTFIYVDRRKSSKHKSLGNRQKLLDRIKESIRTAKPEDIADGGVKAQGTSQKRTLSNPVKIAKDALHEPTFHYDPSSGIRDVVLIGNDRFERGDKFPVDDGSGGEGRGNRAGRGGGDQEDDFIINISRNEFFDVFFEDCELPDLQESSQKELPDAVSKPAGFQREGNASQLSVIRSYRNSLGRRNALTAESRNELQELEEELSIIDANLAINPLNSTLISKHKELTLKIEAIRSKICLVPFFEKLDLRYRKTEKVQVKQAEAVLVMVMDISGSMDEDKKRIARKFFSLQYAFIKRKYPNTDLVFIAHTEDADEMNEDEFFSTRKSGGTVVSSGLKLALDIIKSRYDSNTTNIYLSYAGDGDNWDSDNALVMDTLEKGLLYKLRHMVYTQVGKALPYSYSNGGLWNVVNSVAKGNKKLHTLKIISETDVFGAFKSVYQKRDVKKKETS